MNRKIPKAKNRHFIFLTLILTFVLTLIFFFSTTMQVFAASSSLLKKGMKNNEVKKLQSDLAKLGFFYDDATGFFGDLTEDAVKRFQVKYGLDKDGMAGKLTSTKISSLINGNSNDSGNGNVNGSASTTEVSTSSTAKATKQDILNKYMKQWFKGVDKLFKIGTVAEIYDINTGKTFHIKRTYGSNHADCETPTMEDTKIMKEVFGGEWTWVRRPVIVRFGDYVFAASLAGMPHAGDDDKPRNKTVSSRSGGYGRGMNLDAVKENAMDGHFDLHFYKSRTHATNSIDTKHQANVKKAAEWAYENLEK